MGMGTHGFMCLTQSCTVVLPAGLVHGSIYKLARVRQVAPNAARYMT